jgi:hypothetical protein
MALSTAVVAHDVYLQPLVGDPLVDQIRGRQFADPGRETMGRFARVVDDQIIGSIDGLEGLGLRPQDRRLVERHVEDQILREHQLHGARIHRRKALSGAMRHIYTIRVSQSSFGTPLAHFGRDRHVSPWGHMW